MRILFFSFFLALSFPLTSHAGSLIAAVSNGDSARAISIINSGANINTTTRNGTTPLSLAAETGHADIVKALLGAGADIDVRNKTGMTALGLAKDNGHADIADMLTGGGARK